MHNVITRIAAL